MTSTGLLKKEGGIFSFKLTEDDVENLIRQSAAGLSPAEKVRRAQAEEQARRTVGFRVFCGQTVLSILRRCVFRDKKSNYCVRQWRLLYCHLESPDPRVE